MRAPAAEARACVRAWSRGAGESVPVRKTGYSPVADGLSYGPDKSTHCTLYGGTVVAQSRAQRGQRALAMVCRTRFYSSKGQLLRCGCGSGARRAIHGPIGLARAMQRQSHSTDAVWLWGGPHTTAQRLCTGRLSWHFCSLMLSSQPGGARSEAVTPRLQLPRIAVHCGTGVVLVHAWVPCRSILFPRHHEEAFISDSLKFIGVMLVGCMGELPAACLRMWLGRAAGIL